MRNDARHSGSTPVTQQLRFKRFWESGVSLADSFGWRKVRTPQGAGPRKPAAFHSGGNIGMEQCRPGCGQHRRKATLTDSATENADRLPSAQAGGR